MTESTEKFVTMPKKCGKLIIRLIAGKDKPFVVVRQHTVNKTTYTCLKTFNGETWEGDCPLCEASNALAKLAEFCDEQPKDRKIIARNLRPVLRGYFIAVLRIRMEPDMDKIKKMVKNLKRLKEKSPFFSMMQQPIQVSIKVDEPSDPMPQIFATGTTITRAILKAIQNPQELCQDWTCPCNGVQWKCNLYKVYYAIRKNWYTLRKKVGLPRTDPTIFDINEGRDIRIFKEIRVSNKREIANYNTEFSQHHPLGNKTQVKKWLANLPDLSPFEQRLTYDELFAILQRELGHMPIVAKMVPHSFKDDKISLK